MKQMLEYIMQHYTLFLGCSILILLAIIGYYADKTNFGQGKNSDSNDKKTKDIDDMKFSNVMETSDEDAAEVMPEGVVEDQNVDTIEENAELINENVNNIDSNQLDISNELIPENMPVSVDENISEANNVSYDNIDTNVVLHENIDLEKNSSVLSEEEFDRFDEEFNSLLPKKELINTDLLSDIEGLELEKTQKLDLNDVPDLDDIELPKIKQLAQDEQDIWKF